MPDLITSSKPQSNDHKAGQRLALIGLVASAALAFIKIAAGLITGSAALSADGLESASDVLASAIVWSGITIANRPADEKYPYGYGRAESLAGKTVATILLMSAVLLITHSVHRLMGPPVVLPAWILWPLAASFLIKSILAAAKYKTGRRIRSSALMADAGNDAVDMISAVVAATAITLNLIDPHKFAYADPLGGIGVSIIIFLMGLNIFRRTSAELMDEMPDTDLMQKVHQAALAVPGVIKTEKCFGRKSGKLFFFDLHIEVAPDMTVLHAHELAHRVKDNILQECSFARDVLVHVEPYKAPASL